MSENNTQTFNPDSSWADDEAPSTYVDGGRKNKQPPRPPSEEGVESSEEIESFVSFDDMKLREEILRGIYAYGFEKPSAIQQKAIVPISMGRDVVAQAQSGTGKTATFAIGMLSRIDPACRRCQAIVLSPTRELADQSYKVTACLADYMNIKVHCCVGGQDVRRDMKEVSQGVHIVVGTPGRVFDMIQRRSLDVSRTKIFILDEADDLLSRGSQGSQGFEDQIKDIFSRLPHENPEFQSVLVSATMMHPVLKIADQLMQNPLRILVKADELTLEGIRQFYVYLDHESHKLETLCDLYETLAITQSIIYVNSRKKADWLTDQMSRKDFTVSCTHGDMDQNDRKKVLEEFRRGSSRVLITTDVLARGIDVQQVSMVLNYDIPSSIENYLHRIGRSGRFGRKGVGISLVGSRDESDQMSAIQKYYDTVIDELPANIQDLI